MKDREKLLLDLISSPYRRAVLMNVVQETCGISHQHLEAITKKLDQLDPTNKLGSDPTNAEAVYSVLWILHNDISLVNMCMLNMMGQQTWQRLYYHKHLAALARLAEEHNRLASFEPQFFDGTPPP